MGLASAMSTALTGMSAAETTIDVVGNNLANSSTVGFKASTATFATQFLATQSLGSSPTTTNGGTNPRQIGLGTMVSAISPNFNQGTISLTSNSNNMAIQGDGFFIVSGQNGGQNYTRNGVFSLNASNQLTTSTGNMLMGYGVDNNFNIQSTQLVPITIPLGSAAVAKATENIYLEGTLAPQGVNADLATAGRVIDSVALGNAAYTRPGTVTVPEISTANALSGAAIPDPGSTLTANTTYYYYVTFSDVPQTTIPHPAVTTEGRPSLVASATTDPVIPTSIQLSTAGMNAGHYGFANVYRSSTSATTGFQLIRSDTAANMTAADFVDDGLADISAAVTTPTLSQNYTYYIAYANADGSIVSRPSDAVQNVTVTDGFVHFYDFPPPPADDPNNPNPTTWTQYVIYRNYPGVSGGGSRYVEVERMPIATTFNYTDHTDDATLATRSLDPTKLLNFIGPGATGTTALVNLIYNAGGTVYTPVFSSAGTLQFTGEKPNGSKLAQKDLTILGDLTQPPSTTNPRTTVNELLEFFNDSMGIQRNTFDATIPDSLDIPRSTSGTNYYLSPGATINNGVIRIVSNNGVKNGVGISIGDMKLATPAGVSTVNMTFSRYQEGVGESVTTDSIVYDSLGTPLRLRLTMDMESSTDTATTYRWYADSSDNQEPDGSPLISVGTGTISFDGQGNFTSATNDTVAIYRSLTPAISPLVFRIDFSQITGLSPPAGSSSTVDVARQDGSGTGTLTSFIVGENGLISGVFSNGITRDLAQIRLARFSNPQGLQQLGQNLFSTGVNSGLPIQGNPGQQGIGNIVAGAVELSNTDVGKSLTDLILASTMYRGNARVITTTDELFDELLSLKR
jgi:flagellar hook protein FlgE